MITQTQLQAIMPNAGSRAARFLGFLNETMHEFGIESKARMAAFLATVGHESGQLSTLEENLNYSADALMRTWPAHFTLDLSTQYARQPEKIANRAYASRGGNGDEASGDGWRYRGAGLIQLTFKDNQGACADHFCIPKADIGNWLRTPEGASRSAGWFWFANKIDRYADIGDFDGVCDTVNRGKKTIAIGDSIGWQDRLAMFERARAALA